MSSKETETEAFGASNCSSYFEWNPKPDITTSELAECIKVFVPKLMMNMDLFKVLPEDASRHFVIVTRQSEGRIQLLIKTLLDLIRGRRV